MKKLLTVTYGSRLYGTHTEESDRDFKVIYLPELKDLLLGNKLSIDFTSTSNSSTKNSKTDTDIEYIPLQRLVIDFYEGQTYAYEVVFALNSEHIGVTVHKPLMYSIFDTLVKNYVTNSVDSMVGFAMSQSYKYGIKGRRYNSILHVYETLCSVSDEHKTLSTIISKIEEDDYVSIIDGNLMVIDKLHQSTTLIKEVKERVKKMLFKYGDRTKRSSECNDVDWKSVSHAVRISGMCVNFLKSGEIFFPLNKTEVNLLKTIKGGEMPWAEVEAIINSRQDTITELKKSTKLPDKSESMLNSLNANLYEWLNKLYNINLK